MTVSLIHATDVELSHEEIKRYSRHLIMPEVGIEGQKKLKAAKILLVGTGGLGSPTAMYLAAAGIGTLGLVDYDVVDVTNLQRQIIHGTKDVGVPKIESAASTLADLNPHVKIIKHEVPLTSENALEIIKDYDIVIDGTDNFPTRYLVNDACVMLGKVNIYGSIFRFEGQVSVFGAEDGPCYRCLFPSPPPPGLVPNCAEGGVLGILPGTIGTLQATEAIKIVLGIGKPLIGRLLLYDALEMSFDFVKVKKNPHCPVCGENPTITGLIDYEQFCGMPAHDHSQHTDLTPEVIIPAISVKQLKSRLDSGEQLVIIDVREAHERDISALDVAIHIPKGEVRQRLSEIPHNVPVVVHCRTGGRSGEVVKWLMEEGYTNVVNLAGGINAWARLIDPSIPEY
ncbi:MAG: molybdenum cofactor biosynthesis protein MoeB [Phototrophicales bacterium]|nr:MAG: molybdenum cofactor biosynthesis protein MoeB [Phototrophicales bacterium]